MKSATTLCSFVAIALLAAAISAAPASHNIFDDDWAAPKAAPTSRPVAIKPTPTIDPVKVPDKPTTKPKGPVKIIVIEPPVRRPVPTKSEQAAVRKLLKEVFAQQLVDRTPPARKKLTEALLKQVDSSTDAPVDQFVLLAASIDAATDAASLPLAFDAADRMGRGFEVDALSLKTDTVAKLTPKPAAPESAAENFRAAMELVDQLADADDFVAASRVCSAAIPMAGTQIDLRTKAVKRQAELVSAREASDKVARFVEKLKTTPDDPEANFAVGRYLCILRGQWDTGLPHLAKGSDPAMKTLAALDLSAADDAAKQSEAAEGWWAISEKETSSAQQHLRERGAYWYQQALPSLPGLKKAIAERRIAQVADTGSAAGTTSKTAGGSKTPTKLEAGLETFEYDPVAGEGNSGAAWFNPGTIGAPINPPDVTTTLSPWHGQLSYNVSARGFIMIDQPGKYSIQTFVWYGRGFFYLDGKVISIWGEDRGIKDVELTKGLHEVLLVRLVSKDSNMTINWRPPGTKELVPIPDNILFHDPANKRPPPIPGLNKP